MLDRLSSRLPDLRTRDRDDAAIAFLDAAATLADVLTFYQERIANEAYLRTATERLSIIELANLVGYRARPGVAATGYLAFTLDAGYRGPVPAGTRASSLPAPGELPQSFETTADLDARAEWNLLRPRLTMPQPVSNTLRKLDETSDDTETSGWIYLSGIQTKLTVNDASNAKYLDTTVVPVEVELGTPRKRAVVRAVTRGFGTFLGPPYVFTEYNDALAYLGWSPEYTAFIAIAVSDTTSLEAVKSGIRARLPEADVWSADEFASSSSSYWLIQTGAGGALLTAATLGFLVGLVIVSQNMYAITLENIEEFATLKALGASNVDVATIVSLQALISGAIGTAIGMIAAVPGVGFASNLIPWIFLPGWLVILVAAIGIAMCLAAGLVAVRPAMNIDPARVFRA
jgi:hypothetical protein